MGLFEDIRLYSSRTEDTDREDYIAYLGHQGLSPYFKKIVDRYGIQVPNKKVWDEDTLLKISIFVVRRNYLSDQDRTSRLERLLRTRHPKHIKTAYGVVSREMIGYY